DVRAFPAQGVEDDDWDALAGGIDLRRYPFQRRLLAAARDRVRKLVTVDDVCVDLTHVAAADDVVELVEEHAFPGLRQAGCQALAAEQGVEGIQPLGVGEERLEAAVPLLDGDPRAVGALEDGVEVAFQGWEVGEAADLLEVLRGRGDDELDVIVGAVVLREESGNVRLDVGEISAADRQEVRGESMLLEVQQPLLGELPELVQVSGCSKE